MTTDAIAGFGMPPHLVQLPAPCDVLADAPHYDDATVICACRLLIAAPSTDPETRARAGDMLTLVEGELRESCTA